MIIVSSKGSDVINLEIDLIFAIKAFFYVRKKSRKQVNYLENEKMFHGEIKEIFFIIIVFSF